MPFFLLTFTRLYSILRVFLQEPPASSDSVRTQLQSLGLDSVTAEAVEDHVADTQCEGQWLEKEVTNRLTHLLQATWFVMAGGDRIVATGAGSRPGDPLADLVWSVGWMLASGRLGWCLTCHIRPLCLPRGTWVTTPCPWSRGMMTSPYREPPRPRRTSSRPVPLPLP